MKSNSLVPRFPRALALAAILSTALHPAQLAAQKADAPQQQSQAQQPQQ